MAFPGLNPAFQDSQNVYYYDEAGLPRIRTGNSSDWGQMQIEYTAGNPIYLGKNISSLAALTSPDWTIFKYSYTGSDITNIKKVYGAWSARTSLF